MADPVVRRVAPGTYVVEHDGRRETVWVAGTGRDRWAFWNGTVYRLGGRGGAARPEAAAAEPSLGAPMPATVVKVFVSPGDRVEAGETVIVLEAMKMELAIRAPATGTVRAIRCREGELVQPGVPLLELA